MLFHDRRDAGRQLAAALGHLKPERAIVLGLPRGGVVVASEIARALDVAMDVLIVRKLGAPDQPELAIGAVTNGAQPAVVLNEDLIRQIGVAPSYLNAEIARELDEVRARQSRFRRGRPPLELATRTIIVVDDGIATGATVRAALKALRQFSPARIVLAAPVAAAESLDELEPLADETVVLHAPHNFMSVGRFYLNFEQTTDEEVVALLDHAAERIVSA